MGRRFGGSVINPFSNIDLSEGGPVFKYHPSTGEFKINNRGPNGVVDSSDNLTLSGDDTGTISLVISLPENPVNEFVTVLGPFEDGIAWAAPSHFGAKVQLSGNAIFLPVSAAETTLFILPTGLDASDFRDANGNIKIEAGVNFNFGAPGATLFPVGDPLETGAFVIVPEPSSIGLLGLCLAAVANGTRRRRTRFRTNDLCRNEPPHGQQCLIK